MRWIFAALPVLLAVSPAWAAPLDADTKWVVALEHKTCESRKQADQIRATGTCFKQLFLDYEEDVMEPTGGWPKFKCAHPLRGEMDLSGTLVSYAFDQSNQAKDVYDVLFIDLNVNGKFEEAERIVAKPGRTPDVQEELDFGAITILLNRPGHDALHFRLSADMAWGKVHFYRRSWCYLEGSLDMDGVTKPVRLIDCNANGSFADYGEDRIEIGPGIISGVFRSKFSRVLRYNGKLLALDIATDGNKITFSPYSGKMGKVKVEMVMDSGQVSTLTSQLWNGEDIAMDCLFKPGETIDLPEGEFEMQFPIMSTVDKRVCATYLTGRSLRVVGDQETVWRFGKPLTLEVMYSEPAEPGGKIEVRYCTRGVSGEEYTPFVCWTNKEGETSHSRDNAEPKVVVKDASGEVVAEGVEESG